MTDYFGGGGQNVNKYNFVSKNIKSHYFQIQGGEMPPPQMTSLLLPLETYNLCFIANKLLTVAADMLEI